MRLETIKSVVLVCLVGLSLALTLGIWNYQPDINSENGVDNTIEAKIGSDENKETKKSIIQPSLSIYHINGIHQGLQEKQQEDFLYQEIQSWSMYDFINRIDVQTLIPVDSQQYVEVIFPTSIPTEVIRDLFTIDEDRTIPGQNFDRMFILLDEDRSGDQVQFVDTQNNSKLTANIQNFSEKRERLIHFFNSDNELIEYVAFTGWNRNSIYIPKEPVSLQRHPFQARQIAKVPLRNALFPRPSTVRSNNEGILGTDEEIYTDAQRKMVITNNYMEFTNPIQADDQDIDGNELITETLDFVNDHNGWTTDSDDEYVLYDLNLITNRVEYRLVYQGYPVFENDYLSTISVSMRANDINQYTRPLIELRRPFNGQEITLLSGQQVINEIERNSRYATGQIRDIAIGYRIEEQSGGQFIYTLIPSWFVDDGYGWRELVIEEVQIGGGVNAVGSN